MTFLQLRGFSVNPVDSIGDGVQYLVSSSPVALLHMWADFPTERNTDMHRRMAGQGSFETLVRVVLVPEISKSFLAMGRDYLIDRLIEQGTLDTEIIKILSAAIDDKAEQLEFRELVGLPMTSDDYDQSDLDLRVEEAYQEYPENRLVQWEYTSLLLRRDDLDTAEQFALQLLQDDPDDLRSMNLLGRVYMKQKRFGRAIKILSQADLLNPGNPERLVLVGDAFYHRGELDQAAGKYEAALEIDPESREAHNGLGTVYVSQGEAEKALAILQNVMSEDETASFFNNAAVLAVASKKTKEALKLYETALKSLKTSRYAHLIFYNVALAFLRLGEEEEAIEALKTAIKYEPSYDKARNLLNKIVMKVG